jgi:hypothetical protein
MLTGTARHRGKGEWRPGHEARSKLDRCALRAPADQAPAQRDAFIAVGQPGVGVAKPSAPPFTSSVECHGRSIPRPGPAI